MARQAARRRASSRRRSPGAVRVRALHVSEALAAVDPLVQTLEQRAYNAAQLGRMNSDWSVSYLDANEEIRQGLRVVRAASRNLERNASLYRRWLALVVGNVVRRGFELESTPRNPRGAIDKTAAAQIESAWKAWARGRVSLDGKRTFAEEQRLWIRSIARDGEVLTMPVIRSGQFRLRTLEADYLSIDMHLPRDRTVLGVTLDDDMRPVQYWLSGEHPGSTWGSGWSRAALTAYPADEVIHAFVSERPGQVRGVPWGTAAFDDLLMLQGYKVAELAAARIAASRPVSIETQLGVDAKFTGDQKDAQGRIEFDGAPGGITVLPAGKSLKALGSDHPKSGYGPFTTEVKRDVAAGLSVSYHALNSDLSGANYSSLRHGRADEIRNYEGWQDFFAASLLDPVFEAWLNWYLLSGQSALPFSRREKFLEHTWHAPLFEPLDPAKEADAIEKELALGLTSRSDESAKRGRVFEETVEKIAADDAVLKKHKVALPSKSNAGAPPVAPKAPAKPDPEDEPEPEPEEDEE